jgi:predicted PurR-regulated permease PerM
MTDRRPPSDHVPAGVQVAAAWAWRLLLIAAALYVLGQAFFRVELVAFSFILALFFTAVLHPLERLINRAIPKPASLSAALALLIGIAALTGIGWFVAWQISDHSEQLGNQISDLVTRFSHWLHNGPLHLKSSDIDKLSTQVTNAVKSHQGQLISGAIATVRTVAEALGALLLILLSTFFLLRDGELIWGWVLRLLPRAAQARLDLAARIGWGSFGGYMRGQVLIALFHGVSVMIVLFVLRVPLAAALGVLIFLGSFVPIIGLTITGSLCVAVALLEHGLTAAVVVAIAIVVLIQLEAHLLQPFIMSRSVEVHPLGIALSVLTGTLLAGIPGALLAVPLVAFLNTTITALRRPLEMPKTQAVLEKLPPDAPAEAAIARPLPGPGKDTPPKSRVDGSDQSRTRDSTKGGRTT